MDNRPNPPSSDDGVTSSVNSGAYNPGPINDRDLPTAELEFVQAQQYDIQLEEFPEGPYGSPTNMPRLGKSTPWRAGQVGISAYRDENPVTSARKVSLDEPPPKAPRGSIEGQN
jgi:hypothetical protein